MEKNKKSHLWDLLLLLLLLPFGFILAKHNCTADKDCTVLHENLSCYTDYNYSISCVWKSPDEHQDSVCTLEAVQRNKNRWNSSCQLRPEDPSRPRQKACTMLFKKYRFVTSDVWLITISCESRKQVLSVLFKPVCRIKFNPPPKPKVNNTTVFWFPQYTKHVRISQYSSQLQLRRRDQPWRIPSDFFPKECKWEGVSCSTQLIHDLIKGETYEARIRVRPTEACPFWSDWSPSESWVATVGIEEPTPAPSAPTEAVTLGTLAVLVVFVLMFILVRTDRTNWVYIVKRLRGPPLPHPGKSFLQEVDFKSPKNPPFCSESFCSPVKPIEISQVEVASTHGAVAPTKLEEKTPAMFTDKAAQPSTSSSFSNPVYSHLSPQLPSALLLAPGNLEARDAATAVGCHGADEHLEQDEGSAILRLLSEGTSESTIAVSDYEKVERAEQERSRLQSLDSGVGGAGEVSQESLEADSMTKTADEDEDEREQEEKDFLKLFGGGGVVDKGSIQVCSGYEQIQKMHNDAAELLSLDSGTSSGCGQLMDDEDNLTGEDESVLLLSSPRAPDLRCSSSALASLALKLPGADFGGAAEMLEKTPLMSSGRPVSRLEPSADEYLPVRWELKTDAEKV